MNAIAKIDVPASIADTDPRTLTINPENERLYDLDSEDNVALRKSIAEHGVLMPLHIYEDGVVDNGNRRLSNILRLIAEGVNIATVPTIVVARPTDEVDAVVRRLNMNEAKQFSALEQGRAFAKLRDAGMNNTEIAKRTPFTSMHIGNILTLHEGPESVRDAVRNRLISATLAIETLRARAEAGDAEEVISLAIQAAQEQGRKASQRFVDMIVVARTPVQEPATPATPVEATEVTPVATTAPVGVEAPFDLDDTVPPPPAVATEVEVEVTPVAPVAPVAPVEVEAVAPVEVEVTPVATTAPVEVEAETPNNSTDATPSLPSMKQLLQMIAPVIDSLADAAVGGSKAEKAEALETAQDDLIAFVTYAKGMGLLEG